MAVILAGVGNGDEVIMPSFTFVSTANAVVLRGGVPVFVDIRPDTLNLDENAIEAALTPKTRAIIPVHYAGVACEMDAICDIAQRHRLVVIEDAAQALLASYKSRKLGTIGNLATISFHETKNVVSGEGGALLIRDLEYVERAEIVLEKGTDRRQFFAGNVDKYTWVDIGSSYLPSEVVAAVLYAQLSAAETLNKKRLSLWNRYHQAFQDLERRELARLPIVPGHCGHNGHMYYLLLQTEAERNKAIALLAKSGVNAVFHYVPLHSSPAGRKYTRPAGSLEVTTDCAGRLIRLPLYAHMTEAEQTRVIEAVFACIGPSSAARSQQQGE